MNSNKANTLSLLEQAEQMYREVNSQPGNCAYFDADSILCEYITDVPMGLFAELCKSYRTCEDTDTFEGLFYLLTDISFQEFLERCVTETRILDSEEDQTEPQDDVVLPVKPRDEVWVLLRAKSNKEEAGQAKSAQPQICRAIVREVVASWNDGERLTFSANLQVYPNCSDTEDLKDKVFFCAQNVPEAVCFKSRAAATLALVLTKAEQVQNHQPETPIIDSFRDEYSFLSNFFPCPVTYKGKTYLCSEAAFQAQKCPERATEFTLLSAAKAKRLGRQVAITVADWDNERVTIMGEILTAKFLGNPELAAKLIKTGNAVLIEGNNWGDTFWGVCHGKGENHLGKLLMNIRDALQKKMQE